RRPTDELLQPRVLRGELSVVGRCEQLGGGRDVLRPPRLLLHKLDAGAVLCRPDEVELVAVLVEPRKGSLEVRRCIGRLEQTMLDQEVDRLGAIVRAWRGRVPA